MSSGLIAERPEVMLRSACAERTKNSTLWQWAAFGAIALGSCGHLLIKLGVTGAVRGPLAGNFLARFAHYLSQPAAILGLGIYAVGTVLWIYAVSRRNISFLYPMTALTYVIVALGGRFIFAEVIPSGRWLGIGIVVAGVALLQLSAKGEKD